MAMSWKIVTSSSAACVVATALALTVSTIGPVPAAGDAAQDALEARQLVERARLTVESFAADKSVGKAVSSLIKKAKGVYIAPEVLRGAFVVGDDKGQWNGPAFYTIGEASFGFQAGVDKSEVVLLIMSDRGVSSMLANSVKLGADLS